MSCARAMSWKSEGAFVRGESAIEFGRDPPVSESRELVVRDAELPAEFWARVSELIESRELSPPGCLWSRRATLGADVFVCEELHKW